MFSSSKRSDRKFLHDAEVSLSCGKTQEESACLSPHKHDFIQSINHYISPKPPPIRVQWQPSSLAGNFRVSSILFLWMNLFQVRIWFQNISVLWAHKVWVWSNEPCGRNRDDPLTHTNNPSLVSLEYGQLASHGNNKYSLNCNHSTSFLTRHEKLKTLANKLNETVLLERFSLFAIFFRCNGSASTSADTSKKETFLSHRSAKSVELIGGSVISTAEHTNR